MAVIVDFLAAGNTQRVGQRAIELTVPRNIVAA